MKTISALLLLAIMPLAALHAAEVPPKRNVVLLLADDLRPDCLSMGSQKSINHETKYHDCPKPRN